MFTVLLFNCYIVAADTIYNINNTSYLLFSTVETLPWDIRKLLKWRMSPITPNVVKHTLARSGFRITKSKSNTLDGSGFKS